MRIIAIVTNTNRKKVAFITDSGKTLTPSAAFQAVESGEIGNVQIVHGQY